MAAKSLAEINKYTGVTINPIETPDITYELYSVPSFDNQYPEIIRGIDIGSSKITVEENDVLICKINPRINRVWVVKQNTEHQLIASSEWIVVRNHKIDSNYLKWYFSSPTFRTLLTSQVTGIGGSLTRAQPKQVAKYPISLHSSIEQQQIAATLEKITDLISFRKQQVAKLNELVKSQFIEMFCPGARSYKSWPVKKVGDISDNMRTGPFGSALLHTEFVDSGVFVLGIDNAVENYFSYNRMRYITEEKYEQLKRYTVHPGDVIITIMGTVGRSAVIPEEFPKAINTKHLACLTLNKNVANPHFICYAFQQHPLLLEQMYSQSKGAIMDGLNLTIIRSLQFPLPPLKLQNQFVDFVQVVDKSKFEIQKSLEKLEALKKALMQQYFG